MNQIHLIYLPKSRLIMHNELIEYFSSLNIKFISIVREDDLYKAIHTYSQQECFVWSSDNLILSIKFKLISADISVRFIDILFNQCSELLERYKILTDHLGANSIRLIFATFDPVPDLVRKILPRHCSTFQIGLPLTNKLFNGKFYSRKVLYAVECKNSFMPRDFTSFQSLSDIKGINSRTKEHRLSSVLDIWNIYLKNFYKNNMSVNINYINFCNLHLFLSDLDRLKLALLIEKRNENFLIMGNHLFDFGIRSSKTIRYNSSIFNNRICIDPGSHSFRSKYYQRSLF